MLLGVKRREFITLLGAAAAWPFAARAQSIAPPTIGFLNATAAESALDYRVTAFRQGLTASGFDEDKNVSVLYRWAEGHYDRLPGLAAELVRYPVNVIAATGGTAVIRAAKAATETIPIVFTTGADPVRLGLVASLNRPGGNATGVTFLTSTLVPKQLEMLHETVPNARIIGFLLNPTNPNAEPQSKEAQDIVQSFGLELVILKAANDSEIEEAFAVLTQKRVGAIVVSDDAFFYNRRDHLLALVARYAVPAIYSYREHVVAGGLMSYCTSLADAYRLSGDYVGRILKGEKPPELPVQQSTKVELVINLKTAKTLGLTFPISLLGRADEAIE
jgi:putative ABC transport system substrate-binding protein